MNYSEKHAAIIRMFPNSKEILRNFSQTQTAETLPATFMPLDRASRDEFESKMEECIRALEYSQDLIDQYQVASAYVFLFRKLIYDARDRGEEVHGETWRAKVALHRQHSCISKTEDIEKPIKAMGVSFTSPSPATISVSAPSPDVSTSNSGGSRRKDTPVRFPPAIPVEDTFSCHQVDQAHAVRVSSQQVLQWKENPDTFPQQQIFFAKIEGTEEAFKLVAFIMMGRERAFYVQFVNEDEAISGYLSDDFFDLLAQARTIEMN
ncbi:hypothetical protein C8R42DRAFT_132431 [Lentinula raphanica]|nr:hypothetical protein C8R42DRAFT_132431 [Lentinula raphanica]